MVLLTWHQADLGSVILAGLVGGYLMALTGLWAGRVPGLAAIDLADYGRRYMVSDRPSAWLVGMGSHLANSVLLTLVFGCAVAPNLPVPRVVAGFLWGEFLAVTLAGLLAAPLTGQGLLGLRHGGPRLLVTNLVLHAVWGVAIGVVYA